MQSLFQVKITVKHKIIMPSPYKKAEGFSAKKSGRDLEGYFEEGRSESFQPPQGPDVHFDRHFSVPTHLQLQAGHRGVPR